MANLSDPTRKEQVLAVLKEHLGAWVDGTVLANEQVGGSEGLKRLRELKREGHLIQKRKHPDPHRQIYQYRMVEQITVEGPPTTWVPPKEVSHGGSDRRSDPARSDTAPHPVPGQMGAFMDPTAVQPEKGWYEWRPSAKSAGVLECVYWTRNPKRRVIGSVGQDFSGGWFWGVLVPEYKGRGSEAPADAERYGGSVPDKESARFAVEDQIRKLRGDR